MAAAGAGAAARRLVELREGEELGRRRAEHALREGSHADRVEEFADVLAWLATIANVAEVDLSDAVMRKYGSGCPGCGEWTCCCSTDGKP